MPGSGREEARIVWKHYGLEKVLAEFRRNKRGVPLSV